MITFSISTEIAAFILASITTYALYQLWKYWIYPAILDAKTKDLETNPKWITDILYKYYGFHDIDFVVVDNPIYDSPRFQVSAKERLTFLVPKEITSDQVEEIGRVALIGKLNIKHQLLYTDKPILWLSILCYLLDGHDISMADASFEVKK